MGHLLVLACFVALGLRDAIAEPLAGAGLAAGRPGWVLGGVGAGYAVIVGALALGLGVAQRRLGRGELGAVRLAERLVSAGRSGAVVLHAAGVLVLGTLDAARGLMGDVIAVDELVVAAGPLAVFVAAWWLEHPIQRRLREAVLLRRLDAGEAIPDSATRPGYVWSMTRTQVLFVLVPVTALLAWSDVAGRVERALAGGPGVTAAELTRWPEWARDAAQGGLVSPALMLAGVAVVFGLFPLALRVIWPTVLLGPGGLGAAIEAAQRAAGVRPGPVLVWRTGHAIANGAVVGFVPWARYVLLSDLLLEALRTEEVQAVAAHEAGHIRHRHAVWLVVALLASSSVGAGVLWWALAWLGARPEGGGGGSLVLAVGALASALLVVGAVSRRFEWQADATAARALTRLMAPESRVVVGEAARAMGAALRRVAAINGVPIGRPGWRHGSIATRLRRLEAQVGVPVDRLPIDREARRIKAGLVAALLLAGALVAVDVATRA